MARTTALTKEQEAAIRALTEKLNTPEHWEKVNAGFRERSVPENGICRTAECGGLVEKAVSSLSRDGYGYGTPYCRKCGREYPFGGAEHAVTVGMEAFQKMLNTSYDI